MGLTTMLVSHKSRLLALILEPWPNSSSTIYSPSISMWALSRRRDCILAGIQEVGSCLISPQLELHRFHYRFSLRHKAFLQFYDSFVLHKKGFYPLISVLVRSIQVMAVLFVPTSSLENIVPTVYSVLAVTRWHALQEQRNCFYSTHWSNIWLLLISDPTRDFSLVQVLVIWYPLSRSGSQGQYPNSV
jgi:hypothetical protein